MKELLSFIKDFGIDMPLYFLGTWVAVLFALTLIPSLNYIPKMLLLYVLTPYVFGH